MKNGSGLLHFSVSHFSVWLVSVAETMTEAQRGIDHRFGHQQEPRIFTDATDFHGLSVLIRRIR
jgi:hypothetical protein